MNSFLQQIKTLKKRVDIRNTLRPLGFDKEKKSYIHSLFFKNKKPIIKLFWAIVIISGIEITTPLLLDIFLKRFSYDLDLHNLYSVLSLLLLVLFVYLAFSYKAIAWQKRITLNIINKVREDWLRFYISKPPLSLQDRDKSNIYVKISYHLSLLQMGIGNSLFVFFQWLLYFTGILLISAIIDSRLLLISIIFIPINALVFFISYIFSAFYLAKDQTLYSKILRYISDTFNQFELIKSFNKEKEFINKVRQMIEIDNHFRIKREIVLRYGNNIIFAILTLITTGTYIYHLYSPISFVGTNVAAIVQILVFGLHLRLIYLSLRMGLYYFPLKLGLFLAVPPSSPRTSRNKITNIRSLVFSSPKVKLYRDKNYQKKVRYSFRNKENYFIRSSEDTKAIHLTHLFSGISSRKNTREWIVKVNEKRMLYSKWIDAPKNILFINNQLHSRSSIYHMLNETIDLEILKPHSIFNFIFFQRKFVNEKYDVENFDTKEFFLLQVANCLIHTPDVVVIDEYYTDLNYIDINKGIEILQKHYEGILIVHSQKEARNNNYHVTYHIS